MQQRDDQMPPTDVHMPHRTLLALHQLVDAALRPLYGPMDLDWITDSVVCVDAHDLQSLAAPGDDPHAALVTFESTGDMSALLIAEPSLCRTVLTKIWSTDRNSGASLTQVESAILQQHLAEICRNWRQSWAHEDLACLPNLTLASTLSMLHAQIPTGTWYVARTTVLDHDDAIGVLLFCYPAMLLPTLHEARAEMTWRARIDRGLNDVERTRLHEAIGRKLHGIPMTAPVLVRTTVALGILNDLERGDVIALDAGIGTDLDLTVLDRPLQGRIARCNDRFAIAVTNSPNDPPGSPTGFDDPYAGVDHYGDNESPAVDDPYEFNG